jgi:hypothetical protein
MKKLLAVLLCLTMMLPALTLAVCASAWHAPAATVTSLAGAGWIVWRLNQQDEGGES